MPEKQTAPHIENQEAKRDIINVAGNANFTSTRKRKYYVIFSCKHSDTCWNFACLLNEPTTKKCNYKDKIEAKLKENTTIEFMGRHNFQDKLVNSHRQLKNLCKHSIFVINLHKPVDQLTYFQLGFAMGNGLEIIGLNDGKNEVVLPKEIRDSIYETCDINEFIQEIGRLLEQIDPIEPVIDNDRICEASSVMKNCNSKGDMDIPNL